MRCRSAPQQCKTGIVFAQLQVIGPYVLLFGFTLLALALRRLRRLALEIAEGTETTRVVTSYTVAPTSFRSLTPSETKMMPAVIA